MVKKSSPSSKSSPTAVGSSVKDSAQQIFQAGLGAIAKAQVESVKALETLVKDGAKIPQRTKAVAEEKLSEATHRMSHMASGPWDKLENIFEERVAKALSKLGVPSGQDLAKLSAQLETLTLAVQALQGAPTAASAPAQPRAARSSTKTADKPKATARSRKANP